MATGGGVSHNCNSHNPCPICGKPDFCNWVEWPGGDKRFDCKRTPAAHGDIQTFSGGLYIMTGVSKENFYQWQPLEQYERFMESRKAEWKKTRQTGTALPEPVNKQAVKKGVNEPLPPEKLDQFYRTFLDMLVLEEKHEKVLKSEWGLVPGLADRIFDTYPVRSLPPYDVVRYKSEERFDNRKSRKRIMAELVETLGEPRGVRGFYKKQSGAWEIACKGGILYPEIDQNGYICGLRYADDYAKCTVETQDGKIVYEYGVLEDDAPAGWFKTDPDGTVERVWTFGSDENKVSLDKKGYPDVPGKKVNGKYKAISSERMVKTDETDTEVIYTNKYDEGTRHVTRPALFTKAGDNCKMVFVTEGEKKAIVANMLLNAPCISIPGVGSIGSLFNQKEGREILEALKERGMGLVVICLDADKGTNAMVLKAEETGVKEAIQAGYKIAVGEWNENFGKGLDDILLTGVKPKIYPVQ